MNSILLSIFLSSYIAIIFIYFNKYKIDLFQAIVFNYLICVVTGSVVLGKFPLGIQTLDTSWFPWALLMGVLFISVFNIIAFSTIKAGVTVTQTANKLSLIIPVLFAWYVYKETMGIVKWVGVILAILAVIFTVSKAEKSKTKKTVWTIVLPILLFIGSGIIDTLTKFVETHFIKNDTMANNYLIAGFFVAGVSGFIILCVLYIFKKKKFHIKHLIAGIILGVPNYFSIFYLIKALSSKGLSSSAIIPINNIGILFVVSIFGIFILKEKMSKLNYIGILLSIISILCIYFGDIM